MRHRIFLSSGVDIVEVERVKRIIKKYNKRFLNRVFLSSEQFYCQQKKNQFLSFSGLFAAKEACSKAIGTGIGAKLSWLDIEISRDDKNVPIIKFRKSIKEIENKEISLSISHTKNFAVATVIIASLKTEE